MVILNLDRMFQGSSALLRPWGGLALTLCLTPPLKGFKQQVSSALLSDGRGYTKRKLNSQASTLITMVTPIHPLLTLSYNCPQIHMLFPEDLGLCFSESLWHADLCPGD